MKRSRFRTVFDLLPYEARFNPMLARFARTVSRRIAWRYAAEH